ncbi:hypothetical protein [Actinomadura rudentiformis]|nr:hypothetical protein [Actinomadura rudentiformis]
MAHAKDGEPLSELHAGMAMLEAETFEIHDHVEATEDLLGWTSCDCSTSTGSSTSSTSTSSSTTSCTSTASCA